MANAERGEVDLEIGGETYTLRLPSNAIAEVEDLLDQDFPEILQRMQSGRVGAQRAMLYAALREKHPKVTLLDAGQMLDGNRHAINEALGNALTLAFPSPGKDAAANPQTASSEAGKPS